MTSFNLSQPQPQPLPTIVVQLRGELGNHMSAIAHGYGLQLYALELFGLETKLLLRHQVMSDGITSNPKWIPTSQTLQRCFSFDDWDFSQGGRWEEFNTRKMQQENWLDFLELKLMSSVNGRRMKGLVFNDNQPVTTEDIHKGLESFMGALRKQDKKPTIPSFADISLPFLFSESIDNTVLVDRYWKYLRSFFTLDLSSSSCCGDEEPYPDESVFHFRNFATEMPNYKGTLQEATPNQTAFELFGHLGAGDKVAITSRFNNERLQLYVSAMRAREINVRVIEGQSGIQDFCFLTKARKELVGNFQSTFVFWAAILGNARKVLLYTVDNPSLKQRFGQTRRDRFQYQWNSDSLRYRVILQLIEYE
ncbi:unnamed protein product [Cylindrotheca closterium]|uniref:Uncharacterized protein n=1 Tax=Cylindrotheca closterium TaxID=2856 RepID=A0AAD2G123_9STRA|nr:unnamed protein product [Cylindrotheca closterium]